MIYLQLLVDAIDAAISAGRAILEVYQTDFEVETKADHSPLTLADKRSHEIIKARLKIHGIPFISEEGRHVAWETRRDWPLVWVVDPLDGTKEFVKRNGEFTVNIALVEKQQPVLGVVYAPVLDCLYFGCVQIGAYKIESAWKKNFFAQDPVAFEDRLALLKASAVKLPVAQTGERPYTVVGSRSHATPELTRFVDKKREEKGEVEFVPAGSSLKICLVAEGAADVYPRLGPTMEWDTAAGQAVAQCSGTRVYAYDDGVPLKYNKPDLLNSWFVVER
jgi:3'(2'), 5'-bisphosphate nucleotidase